MATTANTPVSLPQPVIATSNKANLKPKVSKATPERQYKKGNDKGKGMKPLGKGKKNVNRLTTSAATSAGPSANLRSNLQDKAKHTAALIQEITKELQAIEEESINDEQDLDVTQESDLEQEDSDNNLVDGEQ